MIHYTDVEKTYRQERTSPLLQRIPRDFYAEARKLAQSPEVGAYRETVLEHLKKTYYLRANKIIHYAGRAADDTKPPENILLEELPLYERILQAVNDNKALIVDKPPEPEIEKKPTIRVRMKHALPAIIGSDSKEYGPFKEDDVVELPKDSANLLIEREVAESA
ncbi:MAG: hypothetical protein V1744_04435 [Candidatus Altiarchaeota archaeon]